MNPNLRWAIAAALLLFLGVQLFLRPQQAPPAQGGSSLVIKDQTIRAEDGRVVYRGDIDLAPALARIERGERDPHRNDGSVHRNREGRLPRQADRDYYREYVVRTPGLRSVGPQRLVIGKNGETYYTPDHYQSFVRVR
ncbi:MAG: ribonuclease domain-containing protein [Meiothermus sp.]|nr:ribonuclease domain-containing protein [Meiothermus sp.]